jgi:hypothetical protein
MYASMLTSRILHGARALRSWQQAPGMICPIYNLDKIRKMVVKRTFIVSQVTTNVSVMYALTMLSSSR